jgi:hypothetical protein
MEKAANVTLQAPPNLAAWLASVGFDCTLTLTRRAALSEDAPDPDADPGPTDRAIEGQELAGLRGTLAAYHARGEK